MRRTLRAALDRLSTLWRRASALLSERRARQAGPAPTAPAEDAVFLEHVSEALRRIEAPGEAPAEPPARNGAVGVLPAAAAWFRRLRERMRRHEDAIIAAVLVVGIIVMVIHWVR